jgi:hypothetical protein
VGRLLVDDQGPDLTVRLRRLVVPTVVALAAAVGTAAPASAAVECGLIMPTKVVVDAPNVDAPVTLTSGCVTNDAERASWDIRHETSGVGGVETFIQGALADPVYWRIGWLDTPVGRWVTTPAGATTWADTDLTQNSSVTWLKYGSKLAAKVYRSSTKLTWAATATQWSGRSHKNVVRPRVTVGLFHQTSASAAWTYVKSATTSSTGKATISVGYPKSGNYRLVIAETPTVWAAYSSTIKGRV